MSNQILFGSFIVTNQVFYKSSKSYGLVNIKPLVPGHVLVCPLRVVPRVCQLTTEEAQDFYSTVHKISKTIEQFYQADGLNIAIQDGPLAGQSVPHVHCHIIPRKLSDLPNIDDIYRLLDGKEGDLEYAFNVVKLHRKALEIGVDNDTRTPRSIHVMIKEAQVLAKFMHNS